MDDITPDIVIRALTSRICDIHRLIRPALKKWEAATSFWPHSNLKPNLNYVVSPVRECIRYRGGIYIRKRHELGVTFATFVPMGNREVGVVWTTTRKAGAPR